ncbi:MAG: C25 family peptidase propeptide domain-containing protein, partial [Candidatus Thermoplasmatota archaeon]
MKRKIFVIGIVFLLSLAGFTLAGSKEKKIIYTVTLPNFSIEDYDEKYIEIKIDGSSYLMESGYPVLPKISKTFEIEFGAKNIDIKVFPKNIKEFLIDKEIRPSSAFLPLSIENAQYPKNLNFYSSLEIYPNSWYAYRVGCGLNDKMEHVTFVTVHLFPIRYKPSEGKIYFAKNFEIRIKYEKPSIN